MTRYTEQTMMCPTCHGAETVPADSPELEDWTAERMADVAAAAAERTIPADEALCPACIGTGYVDPEDYR